MPGCEWREEPDGFRYLFVDYRSLDAEGRYAALQESAAELAAHPGMRSLVDVSDMEFDPAWFKAVKEANPPFTADGPRVAVVCAGREPAARTRLLAFLAGGDQSRPFDTHDEALDWLRQQ